MNIRSVEVRQRYTPMAAASLLLALSILVTPQLHAQHGGHGQAAAGGSEHVITMPDNDEVLASSPESIMLHFESDVRLVKLVVKNPGESKEPIDIGFRYNGATGVHFVHALPKLAETNYYLVEWAAFDAASTLLKGSFYFSFGDEALPPSYHLEQMRHTGTVLRPDYRLLQ